MIEKDSIPSGFPNELIPASKKNKAWISQFIKASYDEFHKNWTHGFYNARDRYREIELYANGNQSDTKYRKLIDPLTDANGDDSWVNIDWSIIPFIPKLIRMTMSKLNKKDFKITAHAVDPLARDDEDKYYKKKASKIILKEQFEKYEIPEELLQTLDIRKEDPKDFDELEIHMEHGYKHEAAIEIEMALKLVLESWNRYTEDLRPSLRQSLVKFGIAAIKEVVNPDNTISAIDVDAYSLVVPYDKDGTFRDMRYAGHIEEMTVAQLKKDAGDELTSDQYEAIAERYIGKLGNPSGYRAHDRTEGSAVDNWKIEVLNLEFKTVDEIVVEERVNKYGNKIVGRGKDDDYYKKGNKNKSYDKIPYESVYRGKWVLGTQMFYKCEKDEDAKRGSDVVRTSLSYHIKAPFLHDMKTYSLVEQLIPVMDQIQITHYKLQNVILRAKPKGIKIYVDGLEEVPIGKGGKNLTPKQLIDFYNQTGNLVIRMMTKEGEIIPVDPIQELDNGLGEEAQRYWLQIQNYMQEARDILGFNEITDGSTPDPRTLNGVANLAAQSTNDSIQFVNDAEKSITEEVAEAVIKRIQGILERGGDISGYIKALGKNTATFFKVESDISTREFGIIMEDAPDAAQMEAFRSYVLTAQKTGELGTDDALWLEELAKSNIKLAAAMLTYKIRKRKEEASEEAARREQSNAQLQQQSSVVAESEKRKTAQMEHQLKMEQIELEGKWKVAVEQAKGQLGLQAEGIRTEKELAAKTLQTESAEVIAEGKVKSETLVDDAK